MADLERPPQRADPHGLLALVRARRPRASVVSFASRATRSAADWRRAIRRPWPAQRERYSARPCFAAAVRSGRVRAFCCAYRSCIESWLATKGVRLPRTFEVLSYHAMLACVAANVGYVLAPRSVLLATSARTAVRAYRPNKLPWRMTTWLVRCATDRSRAVDALHALVVAGAGEARRETELIHRRPRAVVQS